MQCCLRRCQIWLIPGLILLLLSACAGLEVDVRLRPTAEEATATPPTAVAVTEVTPTPVPVEPTATPTQAPSPSPTPEPATPTPEAVPTVASPAERIAYQTENGIFVLDLASEEEYLLTRDGRDFDWTADGSRAVFVRGEGAEASVWTIRMDGAGEAQLTHNDVPEANPRWSPDGRYIVWERAVQRDAQGFWTLGAEVWRMNADGSDAQKLADGFHPAWSPEGLRIAFASNPQVQGDGPDDPFGYRRNAIRLMNLRGENQWDPISTATESRDYTPLEWNLRHSRLLDSPVWSPDGEEVTFRALDGHTVYITTDPVEGGVGGLVSLFFDDLAWGFSYSPDGEYITLGGGGLSGYHTIEVYERGPADEEGYVALEKRVELGNVPMEAGEEGLNVRDFAWSPDGRWIAYSPYTYVDPASPKEMHRIRIVEAPTGEDVQVLPVRGRVLAWLPDRQGW